MILKNKCLECASDLKEMDTISIGNNDATEYAPESFELISTNYICVNCRTEFTLIEKTDELEYKYVY